MVLGKPELTQEQVDKLVRAGAIFYEKPDDYQKHLNESERKQIIVQRLKQGYENLFVSNEADHLFLKDESEPDRPSPVPEPPSSPDLSSYANPPFQISEDDFTKLTERMLLRDDDWRKDD